MNGGVEAPVLLYDGTCSLCDRSVQFILRHERRHTLRFAALESPFGARVLARHPALHDVDSVVWFEPAMGGEGVFVRSAAALRAARYLGGPWRLVALARAIPRPLRDWAYDLVARHRHWVFGRTERCVVPPAHVRSRFLDVS